jgi:6-phospho-3-hexuloisomerase
MSDACEGNSPDPMALAADAASRFPQAVDLILAELHGALASVNATALREAATVLLKAERIFVIGAGRSGLAARMGAMRLMHFGLAVHVAGEVTAPPIAASDALLAVSGSGSTPGIVQGAEVASKAGAGIVAITTAAGSRLAALARVVLVVDAAAKLDRSGATSQQYAGSLFEQAVMLVFDALFHALWQASGVDAAALWSRHTNLE